VLLLSAWVLTVLARRWNAQDRAQAFYIGTTAAIGLAIAGGAALVAGPSLNGLDPTAHAYPAIVWMLVGWTALHVGLGVIMLGYCVARRAAGRMTARYDIDITNVTLYWHFAALTVALTVAVIAGFPLVA
jgi:cytochrome c oxidase subunit I+III